MQNLHPALFITVIWR